MAIMPYTEDHALVQPWLRMPATAAEVYTRGEALTLASGAVTKQSGANKPQYLSMSETVDEDSQLHASYISDDAIFIGELSADDATLAVGSKLNLDDTGTKFVSDASGTVAVVEKVLGTKAGDKVLVRFIK